MTPMDALQVIYPKTHVCGLLACLALKPELTRQHVAAVGIAHLLEPYVDKPFTLLYVVKECLQHVTEDTSHAAVLVGEGVRVVIGDVIVSVSQDSKADDYVLMSCAVNLESVHSLANDLIEND